MKDFVIKGEALAKLVEESIPMVLKEKFSSSYSNPIATAIEEVLKEQEGVFKTYIKDILTTVLTNDKFKQKVSQELIVSIIQKGLRS